MQAANDNLPGLISGIEDDECSWESLHEAARKVVEACTRERAASHQVGLREEGRKTDVSDSGRADHAETRLSWMRLVSSR
jgi:hypothetical protein